MRLRLEAARLRAHLHPPPEVACTLMVCGFGIALYIEREGSVAPVTLCRLVKCMNGVVERVSLYGCRSLISYSVSHEALCSNLLTHLTGMCIRTQCAIGALRLPGNVYSNL